MVRKKVWIVSLENIKTNGLNDVIIHKWTAPCTNHFLEGHENLKFRNKVNLRVSILVINKNMTSRSAYKCKGQHAINRSDVNQWNELICLQQKKLGMWLFFTYHWKNRKASSEAQNLYPFVKLFTNLKLNYMHAEYLSHAIKMQTAWLKNSSS